MQDILLSSLTLLILFIVFISIGFILKKFKENESTIKEALGNREEINIVIESVYKLLTEVVTDITMSISEKYVDDGIITKDEMVMIKQEAVNSILKRLSEAQKKVIMDIYGDVTKWVACQVDDQVKKISADK